VGAVSYFTDADPNAYWYKAMLWATQEGITLGTNATTFDPDALCTRAQMVTFLYRSAASPATRRGYSFRDVADTAYYYDAVQWAVAEGITNGTDAAHFSPDELCTRGQMVTFLYRYLAA